MSRYCYISVIFLVVTHYLQLKTVSKEPGICFSSKKLEVLSVHESGKSPGVYVTLTQPCYAVFLRGWVKYKTMLWLRFKSGKVNRFGTFKPGQM